MSWKSIAQAFKNKDMRKRLFIIAALVVVYRALSHIPIPLAEPSQLSQLIGNTLNSQDLLGFIDLLSGGALQNFSLMLMGLGPYINASIIMQLLTKAVPKLEELSKDGEQGRGKINQYTRILALPLAIIQSIGVILLLRQTVTSSLGVDIIANAGLFEWALMISALAGGSMVIMWLGELMTEQGVGNGISLLIFASIVSALPSTIGSLVSAITTSAGSFNVFGLFEVGVDPLTLAIVAGIVLAAVAVTYFVVKLNEAQRIVTVSYAKRVRGNRAYGGVDTVLPIKLITAGVIPIIFAFAFLSVPSFAGALLANASSSRLAQIGDKLSTWFATPGALGGISASTAITWNSLIYPVVFFVLVVAFTYFYTGITFNAKEIAENLQKQGGFVTGIRPGNQTEEYLKRIVNRLTLFGSFSLGFLAVLPLLSGWLIGSTQLTIGGTSILIAVSVAIETIRQIESRALMVTYDRPEED